MEVFETSKSNVERLFASNEKWLTKHGDNFGGDMALREMLLRAGDKEGAKQIKSMASRIVLSRFVAFHGHLFGGKVERDDEDKEEDQLLAQFKQILDVNPFGDGLMMKLIAINAFSFWRGLKAKDDIGVTAYEFILKFGYQLSQSLEGVLEKSKIKLEKGGKTTNIRLLGPLLLLCEFVSHETTDENSLLSTIEACRGSLKQNARSFWSGIGKVATVIVGSKTLSQIIDATKVQADSRTLPDDFQSLSKCFIPFSFLNPANDGSKKQEKSSAYVSNDEALDLLEFHNPNTQSQMSQRSRKSAASYESANKSEKETRIKLARFMAFVSKHLDSGDLVKTEEGTIEVAMTEESTAEEQTNGDTTMEFTPEPKSDEPQTETMSLDSQVQTKDILMYKQSEEGQPALLVPGALLLGDTGEKKDEKENYDASLQKLSAMVEEGNKREKQVATPSSVQSDLLSPSSFIAQKDLTSSRNENKDERARDIGQILPPLPPAPVPLPARAPAPAPAATLRPPPGFQPPGLQSPPSISPVPQATPLSTFGGNPAMSFNLPPHRPNVQDQFRSNPPYNMQALHNVHPHELPQLTPAQRAVAVMKMPQTRNPFASRLTQWNGVNLDDVPEPPSNFGIPGLFSKNSNAPCIQNNNHNDIGATNESDLFGLLPHGIFSEDKNSETNSSHQNVQTRNPFHNH